MLNSLVKFYKHQQFFVNFVSIFINPNYFSRKGLLKYVKFEAPLLKGRLLDFGCGRKPYRSLFDVEEYVGVDIEVSGHEQSDISADVFYDGHHLPFDNQSFDCIFASEVFEHLFNLDEILDELNRVLKDDGRMLVTIPFAGNEHEIPYDFGRYTSYGIRKIMEKHGFTIMRLHKSTTYFETVSQSFISYIIDNIFPKNKALRTLLMIIFTGPLALLVIILNFILPNDKTWFLNMIFVAEKTDKRLKI
ncbi:MAG: class I SAM-dependent methyltransferase [Dysgonamonadaceae bacterium]|jgi:SAM-dependent methyltransferase|nr:class I SAM-dependent methyltransferase [Dysgonamonadaceae bacterium]